ncbi:minor tail protein [Mycobacterium phage OmniCritical]|nr:minor tail protein [Mycobacterium phage OmniCritical]
MKPPATTHVQCPGCAAPVTCDTRTVVADKGRNVFVTVDAAEAVAEHMSTACLRPVARLWDKDMNYLGQLLADVKVVSAR